MKKFQFHIILFIATVFLIGSIPPASAQVLNQKRKQNEISRRMSDLMDGARTMMRETSQKISDMRQKMKEARRKNRENRQAAKVAKEKLRDVRYKTRDAKRLAKQRRQDAKRAKQNMRATQDLQKQMMKDRLNQMRNGF